MIGRPEWIGDDRFAVLEARKKNEDELENLIGKWTENYEPEEVMHLMQKAGVPAGEVVGEDNEYVYKEILGYTDDDIAEFLVEGVITTEHDLPGASEE